MVEELITRISFHIYASINGERYVFSSTGMTAVQGATNVFIPLLIASLIVLNTMLGSVYERTREIEIYSSVGLAPSHIGALFMAESCVYAVLGAVSGYVIGQTIAKVVTAFDLLQGLNLNYSSMATVGSTGLVMVVVLLSRFIQQDRLQDSQLLQLSADGNCRSLTVILLRQFFPLH